MATSSPPMMTRAGAGNKGKLPEVKSGILLSDGLVATDKPKRIPPGYSAPIIRTKSGNLRKITSKEAIAALSEHTEETGTRVTSRFARVLLAGSGFLADAYDLFVINLVLRLLRNEYPEYAVEGNAAGVNLHTLEGSVAAAALVGAIIGQLVAGSMADIIGRKKIFVTTAVLICLGSFGSACCGNAPTFTVYGQLAIWRFCLGIGVGGEYPLAATVTSESSSAATRGGLMAGVFSMQGVGSLLSVIIVMACLSLGMSDGFTWRFALAFGALPVLIAFPFRLRMHETETFARVAEERKAHGDATTKAGAALDGSGGSGGGVGSLAPSDYNILSAGQPTSTGYGSMDAANGPRKTSGGRGGGDGGEEMRMVTDYVISDYYAVNEETAPLKGTDGLESGAVPTNGASHQQQPMQPPQPSQPQQDCHLYFGSGGLATMPLRDGPAHSHAPPAGVPTQPHTRMQELRTAFTYYKWHMFGTALCWFLLDVDFYANGLFNQKVTSTIFSTPGHVNTALQDAYCAGILTLIGLPGYYLSVLYIETVGRKQLQMLGFTMMALLFAICSVFYTWLMDPEGGTVRKYLFLLIYALTFLFSNFGPNTTSFVIPGEIFPAEVRATCHGVSAACGKLGAATGAFLFPLLMGSKGGIHPTDEGIEYTMMCCAAIAAAGVVVTYFFIPSYGVDMLVHEGTYMVLDHHCLQPSDEEMLQLTGYELVNDEEAQATEEQRLLQRHGRPL